MFDKNDNIVIAIVFILVFIGFGLLIWAQVSGFDVEPILPLR